MQLPLTDPDTLCEELLQDLPPETAHMAREFKAFVRAKKVKTPAQLLRVVFLYCGLDKSLREVAGTLTALYEAITSVLGRATQAILANPDYVESKQDRSFMAVHGRGGQDCPRCGHRISQIGSDREPMNFCRGCQA